MILLVIAVLLLMALIGYYAEGIQNKMKKEEKNTTKDSISNLKNISTQKQEVNKESVVAPALSQKVVETVQPVPITEIIETNKEEKTEPEPATVAFVDTEKSSKVEITGTDEDITQSTIHIPQDDDLPIEDIELPETEKSNNKYLEEANNKLSSLKIELKDQKSDSLSNLGSKEEELKKIDEDFSKIVGQPQMKTIKTSIDNKMVENKKEDKDENINLSMPDISLPEIKLPHTFSDDEIWK
jgi:hypothetical protein